MGECLLKRRRAMSSPMPTVGQLITIKGSQYRVLAVDGTVAKVLGMADISDSRTFPTASHYYWNGQLDGYLNSTWRQSQDADFQAALVLTEIKECRYKFYSEPSTPDTPTYTYQYQWGWDETDYENLQLYQVYATFDRYVFAPSVSDVYDYYNKRCITSNELNTMFFDQATATNRYVMLRDEGDTYLLKVWLVEGELGQFTDINYTNINEVRAAFQIDLSMIDWS